MFGAIEKFSEDIDVTANHNDLILGEANISISLFIYLFSYLNYYLVIYFVI